MQNLHDARRIERVQADDGETIVYGYFGDDNERREIVRSRGGMLDAYLNAQIEGIENGTIRLRNADE